MLSDDPNEIDSRQLSKMLDLGMVEQRIWKDEELASILDHHANSPMAFDLGQLSPKIASQVNMICQSEGLLLNSLADLFEHPNPPIELLQITKQYAKATHHHPDSALPKNIAYLIYLASIVAARLKCRINISNQSNAGLIKGIDWALSQPWLTETFRKLFEDGKQELAIASEEKV